MKKVIFFIFLPLVALFGTDVVNAAEPVLKINDENYAAKFVSQSIADPIEIEAGKTATVVFKFKNIGKATWNSSSSRFISAYTVEPQYRASQFKDSDWLNAKQTAKSKGTVKPGGIGELALQLKAPAKTGDYIERFNLAAENHTWVKGGYFFVKIRIVKATAESAIKKESKKSAQNLEYQAARIGLVPKTVIAKGGDLVQAIVIYKNEGTAIWKKYSLLNNDSAALAGTVKKLSFADNTWRTKSLVLQGEEVVSPGSFLRKAFNFRAPAKKGRYTASFQVKVDEQILDEMQFEISVNVTEDAPEHYQEPFAEPATEEHFTPRLSSEPRLRVGLWKPQDSFVQFVSYEDDYAVYDGDRQVGVLPKKRIGILRYSENVYSFSGAGLDFSTPYYVRLLPMNDPHAIFTLLNFERSVEWKGPRLFNKYRGALELRLTQDNTTLYAINDVLMEDYVRGIGETSAIAPYEYIKALLTAARTYAYYIKEYSDKHDARNFDVVAHTGDQLYLGCISEEMMPRVVQAAAETRGYMVTYNNDIAITPYFGRSDGRTRAWTEVWGGSAKPWLVSVKADYDKGKRMSGHGVGMSQRDAASRAESEGTGWVDLLKYYYTGVEVEMIYE